MLFARGMAAFQNDNGTWGYINVSGDTIVPATYNSVNLFLYNDYALVIDQNQPNDSVLSFSVIDKSGKVMFSANSNEYQPLQPYYINGVMPVMKGDSLVCLDEDGKEVPNPIDDQEKVSKGGYNDYSRTPSGDYIVVKGKKTGMVDKNNKVLIPIEHDNIIDINGERLAAASLMMMFDETSCCGADASTTLMDLNRMVGTDARMYAGSNTLIMPQGPYVIQYVFDRELATANADSTSAEFNYDARVKCVIIASNLNHCPASTEPAIVNKVESRLGTKGFVFARDGIFCSDYLTALTLGYEKGIMSLRYYMHFNESVPQAKNKRS